MSAVAWPRVAAALLWLGTASMAAAAPPSTAGAGDFQVISHTVDGGGGRSGGGNYSISGSIAQPDADPLHVASGGDFSVVGGFWGGVLAHPEALFDDGFEDG